MKTMLWKEFRENLKWAVLAMLALALAEFYTLSSERRYFNPIYDSFTLTNPSFLLVTSFGCATIGAFLGVMQILPELRRDRWAALLHRPVSRGVILSGKIIAGLLLYALAAALPLFASASYVAMPGVFPAPFVPGMMLPGLSDLSLGVVFYFAALLLCLHRGRWFGTRGMILLSVLMVFLLHVAGTSLPIKGPYPIIPVGASLILLLAAWGAMLGDGPMKSRPWPGQAAFVLVVLIGTQTALLVLLGVAELLIEGNQTSPPLPTRFEVSRDGHVFIVTEHGYASAEVVTDMAGKVITDERYVGNNSSQNMSRFVPVVFDLKYKFELRNAALSNPRDKRYIHPVTNPYGNKELWYFLRDRNYFIGYDALSRLSIGIFDREGFKPPGATPKPFGHPLRTSFSPFVKPVLYWSGPQLYAFDFPERRMDPFFNAKNDTIYAATSLPTDLSNDKSGLVAVALENEIRILDDRGTTISSLPYLHDPDRWSYLSIASNIAFDRLYVQSKPFPPGSSNAATPVFLDEVTLQGKALNSYRLPNEKLQAGHSSWVEIVCKYTAPAIPVLAAKIYLFLCPPPLANLQDKDSDDVKLHPNTAGYWGCLFTLALVLAAFAFLWARKIGFSSGRAWRWAVFVFVFGIAGLLTFRFAAAWPTRVRCPLCGGKRSAENEDSSCCHRAWPVPERNGTEIF